jgi:hypothetical protein
MYSLPNIIGMIRSRRRRWWSISMHGGDMRIKIKKKKKKLKERGSSEDIGVDGKELVA